MSAAPELIAVMTSIQPPTPSVEALVARLRPLGATLIVIGDAKGPHGSPFPPGSELIELEAQAELPFALADALSTGHYARKNLGYLLAMQRGARCLYETDDDNAPLASWAPREEHVDARALSERRWHNPLPLFGGAGLWPRGLPFPHTHEPPEPVASATQRVRAPLQLGLIDGAPDLDALQRLALGSPEDIRFEPGVPLLVPPGGFAPVNSQSTWWWPLAQPFLYLPSSCSFRMTDIWRGLVAQRCLWELDARLVIHGAEVFQDRNPHDLEQDFRDELPGHLLGDQVVETLLGLQLQRGEAHRLDNLRRCHEALVECGAEEAVELERLEAWCEDVEALGAAGG